MKIEKIDENQVKITLSCAEMLQMNAQNYSEESTNMMMELLETVESELSFSMMNHAIVFEMVPSKKDGCEIFLTKTESKQQSKQENGLIILSFEQAKEALHAGTLSKNYVQGRFAIYVLNEEYYLLISSKDKPALSKIGLLLSDLGNTVPNPLFMESVLTEYGTLILQEDMPPLLS